MIVSSKAHKKVTQLMESRMNARPYEEFTEEQRKLIKELAIEFRRGGLYNRLKNDYSEEKKALFEMSPQRIYMHMLERIASAPNALLIQASAALIIPILDDKLDAEATAKID